MYDITNNTSTKLGPVTQGRVFSQKFFARDNFLAGVSVWIATYDKRTHSTATLTLLDEEDGSVLRVVEATTSGFGDNKWQCFVFEPVPDSKGRTFEFRFETDSEAQAVTLWTNDQISAFFFENGAPADAAICYRSHYLRNTHSLLDTLLSSWVVSDSKPSMAASETLHEIIRYCVSRNGYFLHLAHLLDAFNMTNGVTRVLSIGCSQGYHAAYLAARFPHLRVDATELTLAKYDFDLPNLRFRELDIPNPIGGTNYDFVFSIECLARIEDYRTAFRKMAANVAPGKYFYLAVPYASRDEQLDERLRRNAWEFTNRYTPGFDYDTLQGYFVENGFQIRRAENMFERPLAHPLNALLRSMDARQIEAGIEDIVRLFLLDLKTGRVDSCRRAEGIRFLARRGNA
jgi:SAM-dependent methyltransferase